MSDTQRSDVLIVGAGASGLLAALSLSLMDISVRIIDKAPSSLEEKNPITLLSPFTLQRLHALGITDFGVKHWRFQTFTNKGSGLNATSKERQTYRVWENRDAYCNWGVSCRGAALCEKLLEVLHERTGLQVDYNHELVNLQDMTADAIVSTIKNLKTGRAACWRSRIVIGADGTESMVRRKLGITQTKLHVEPPISLYTLQVSATSNFPGVREVATVRKGTDTVLMIGHDNQVYITLKQKTKWSQMSLLNGDDDLLKSIEAHVKYVLQPYDISFNRIYEYKRWEVTNRISEKYCVDRRYFLVGNAAQTTTPNEFLSTNLGIDQVQNLCWKLYLYLRQYAPPTILDTYHAEAAARAREYLAVSELFAMFLTRDVGQEEALSGLKRTKQWFIGCNAAHPDTLVGSHSVSRIAPDARLKPYTALQILHTQTAVKSKSTPSGKKAKSVDNAQLARKPSTISNNSSIWKQSSSSNNNSHSSLGPAAALSIVTPFVRGMTKIKTRGYQHYDSESLVIAGHTDRWKSIKANQYKLSERIAEDGSPTTFTLLVFCQSLDDPEKMQALQALSRYFHTSLLHYEQWSPTASSSTYGGSSSSPTTPIATSPISYFNRFSISSQRSSESSSTCSSSSGNRFSRFFPSFSWSSSTTTVDNSSKQTIDQPESPRLFSIIYVTSSQRQQVAQLLSAGFSSPLRTSYDLSKFYLDQDYQAHRAFEVDVEEGPTVVVIRPDGYIGARARIRDQLDSLGSYFEAFLKPPIDLDSAAALVADDYC